MTARRTAQQAKDSKERYGPVISLENIGINMKSFSILQELVRTTSYPTQILHHAATLGMNDVIYVVGTGATISEGRVHFVRHC